MESGELFDRHVAHLVGVGADPQEIQPVHQVLASSRNPPLTTLHSPLSTLHSPLTMKPYYAIVNPAAGGGRCGRQAPAALERLRSLGVPVESVETRRAEHATSLCREAYRIGYRRFLAVGGDGTGFEVVNGLFPREDESEPVTLGFLPLGTGNSFLRDFSDRGLEHAVEALVARRSRPCDVMRLTHAAGAVHYINLLSIGFTADAGELTNRRFKGWGELGYLMAILRCWMGLGYPTFPFRLEEGGKTHRQPCTYLTFSNSRFTGGKMMIAPQADIADGLIEITRVGAIGRWEFVKTFPRIFSGTHMSHPLIWRTAAPRVEFDLEGPTPVMIDGEVLVCQPRSIQVLPGALQVAA